MARKSSIRYFSRKRPTGRPDPKSVTDVMAQSTIQTIIQKAQQIEAANSELHKALPSRLALHCEVMNIKETELTLCVDDAMWMTQLRFEENRLLQMLQQTQRLWHIRTIRYKVRQY